MTPAQTTPRRVAVVAACALLTASSGAAVATAQNSIPGDGEVGTTVTTFLAGVSLQVAQPDTATVTVTLVNNSSVRLNCAGPSGKDTTGGMVTEALVAEQSLAYYTHFPYRADPTPTFGSTAAGNTIGATVPLAAVLGFLPTGSIAPMFGDAYAARDAISTAHAAAKQAGHAGTTPTFSVDAGRSITRTVTLSPPSTGARTDFTAGFFAVCTDPVNRAYAFAGYEGGSAPVANMNGIIPLGSIGRI